MFMTTTVKRSSMRGTVLTYVLSEPGEETVNSIVDDLYHGTGTRKKVFNAVYDAVSNLRQRGILYYGDGPNRTNRKLHAVQGAADCLV